MRATASPRKARQLTALLVGCGRIGVGGGAGSHRVNSHAGALALNERFQVYVYDPNPAAAASAQRTHGVEPLSTISNAFLALCDCAVIASPSPTHAEYLLRFMGAGVRLIVCEKPLCTNHDQLQLLTRAAASVESNCS